MNYGEMVEQQIKQESADVKAWQADMKVTEQLSDGVQKGETFTEYQTRTGCPNCLRERYLDLQRRSGIAPHSVKQKSEDPFVTGFRSGNSNGKF